LTQVVIYLDVDGVLGPLGQTKTDARPTEWPGGLITGPFGSLPIHYAPELIERLHALQDAGVVEFAFATSWEHNAQELVVTMELQCQDWPILAFPPQHNDRSIWWKWKVVREDWERRGRPTFVWVDDDLMRHLRARRWVESTPNGHWISPHSEAGISPVEMDRIEAIVAKECARDRPR
jgi:hypothetical protein